MRSEKRRIWNGLMLAVLFGTVIALSIGTASEATLHDDLGESVQATEPLEPNNSIRAGIFRYYILYTTSNSVVNQTYIIWPRWKLKIENTPDTSGAAVNVSNVTLESPIEFRRFKPNPTYVNPPAYFWDLVPLGLSNISEDSILEIHTYPNYTKQQALGFGASREISPETFASTSNLSIIVNYTARETLRGFTVYIDFMLDTNLIKNVTVIDYSSQYLDYIKDKKIEWDVPNPSVGTTYTSTLKLRIEPIDNTTVKYLPHVQVREYVDAESPIIQNNQIIVQDFGNFTICSNAIINKSFMNYVRGVTFESILEEIPAELPIFDTGEGTYPSISGTFTGTITPSRDLNVSTLYTYNCKGTGGHTKSIQLYEDSTLQASGAWSGYQGDWHNITLVPEVTLLKDHEYRYVIVTGSYPQIIHMESKLVTGGTITCEEFMDVNGVVHGDWIPAIWLG
jgi:hypothetical protein